MWARRCVMPGVRREGYTRAGRAGEGWGLEYVEVVGTALFFGRRIARIRVDFALCFRLGERLEYRAVFQLMGIACSVVTRSVLLQGSDRES